MILTTITIIRFFGWTRRRRHRPRGTSFDVPPPFDPDASIYDYAGAESHSHRYGGSSEKAPQAIAPATTNGGAELGAWDPRGFETITTNLEDDRAVFIYGQGEKSKSALALGPGGSYAEVGSRSFSLSGQTATRIVPPGYEPSLTP
jgi:hypothetical protein